MFGFEQLSVTRVNGTMTELVDVLETPASLIFLNTTTETQALDSEIFGQFENRAVSADIIADDQSAVVRAGGRFRLNTSAIPNLKTGTLVTQEIMNLLRRINLGGGLPGDSGFIRNWIRNELAKQLDSVRILKNRMIAGMHLDMFSYNKLGIKYDNITWGMPSTVKFVPSISWTAANAGTMTPVADIRAMRQTAIDEEGEEYNYVRLSNKVYTAIVNSTEFRTQSAPFTSLASAAATFPSGVVSFTSPLFEQLTGLKAEITDATFKDELNDGTRATRRYLPENYATLGNTADNNNAASMDFGQSIVNETEVGTLPGTQVVGGGFPAPSYGPVSYATARGDLNPPNFTMWTADRGFPRRHRPAVTGRIKAF